MKKAIAITLFLLSAITFKVSATAQIPDLLIYKGDTLLLHTCPLSLYPNRNLINPHNLFGGKGCFFSACWRNYVATWELTNDKLFLVGIRNACYPTDMKDIAGSYKAKVEKDSIGTEYADLQALFPEKYHNGKVEADWVTEDLTSPQGKLLFYVHNGFESAYEKEVVFKIAKGNLEGVIIYDNSKSKRSEYSRNAQKLREYIHSNINWDELPEQGNSIKVTVSFSANENGIVDSVKIARGFSEIFDQEAVRVVKSIPEWDVYYQGGQHKRRPMSLQVIFDEKISGQDELRIEN